MGYLDTYRSRLGFVETIGEAHKDASKKFVNDNFSNSPSYTRLMIDGLQEECLLQSDKTGDMRILLFRPSTVYNRGSYVEIGGDKWLITDFSGSDVYPKAMLQRCNESITWVDDGGIQRSYGVVANSNATLYQFGFIPDKMMQMVNMEFHAFAKFDENTAKIKENSRFVLSGKTFVVIAVDQISLTNNYRGIVRIHLKADILRDTDDVTTGIADNSKTKVRDGKLW